MRICQIWSARNTYWRLWCLPWSIRCGRGLRVYDAVKIDMRLFGVCDSINLNPILQSIVEVVVGDPVALYEQSADCWAYITILPSLLLFKSNLHSPSPEFVTPLCFGVCNFLTASQRNTNWHHEDQVVLGMQTRQIQLAKNTCRRLWCLWQHQAPCIHHLS